MDIKNKLFSIVFIISLLFVHTISAENRRKGSPAPSAISYLIQQFTNKSTDLPDRHKAAMQLGQISTNNSFSILHKALSNDKEVWLIRKYAAEALGLSKNPKAIKSLVKALKTDESELVRSDAALSLGNFKSDESISALISASQNDTSVFVRSDAVRSLGKIGNIRAIGPLKQALKDKGTVITLIKGVEKSEQLVKKSAIEALVKIEGKKTIHNKTLKETTHPKLFQKSSSLDTTQIYWAIQIGSYTIKDVAKFTQKRLIKKGYNAYITETESDNSSWYRLRIGFFPSKKEAKEKKIELANLLKLSDLILVTPVIQEVVTYSK